MSSRRNFLKKSGVAAACGVAGASAWQAQAQDRHDLNGRGGLLTLLSGADAHHHKPLEQAEIGTNAPGRLRCLDGRGTVYYEQDVDDRATFTVGGALGQHHALLLDRRGRLLDILTFAVDGETDVDDAGGEFRKLWQMAVHSTMLHPPLYRRVGGKTYKVYAGWFQDHVHVLKAQKYYDTDVVSGMDLWTHSQRPDGMVADNCKHPPESFDNWATRFGDRFVYRAGQDDADDTVFVRIPIENMGEFTYLIGVWETWTTTGDDAWMASKIDACKRAVDYATSDDYRWSERFRLPKRGYTIDIWDFQPRALAAKFGGDTMMAKPGVTDWSVMYGDTIGLQIGCKYLGRMLAHLGRDQEAARYRALGEELLARIDALAWTGTHYRQHVPEDPVQIPDFGDTPLDEQVTLSHAYALNRDIDPAKGRAIIRRYQQIREKMPASSPGEWYLCFPAYEQGWHVPKWEYMNGGVSPLVGGELAHGAFRHGFEAYGVDVLRRMAATADAHGDLFEFAYRGSMAPEKEQTYVPLDLSDVVNADTHGAGAPGVPGFTGEADNDLANFPTGAQTFEGVPFQIVDPAANGRKGVLILSARAGYTTEATVPYGDRAGAFYLVHAQGGGDYLGKVVLHYADGTTAEHFFKRGDNVHSWWFVSSNVPEKLRVAADVPNAKSRSVGAYLYGFNNPHPERTVRDVRFELLDPAGDWIVLGLTASPQRVAYAPQIASYGGPRNWAAAAVHYALLEGLAGVKSTGPAFGEVTLAPRWTFAGVDEVRVMGKYPASNGYAAYEYTRPQPDELHLRFTSSATRTRCLLPLPDGRRPARVLLNDQPAAHNTETVEQSTYLRLDVERVGAHELRVFLA
ncbi:MAG: twin-arginine translocation signal domain-containing protein [Catalinimonas sp.]